MTAYQSLALVAFRGVVLALVFMAAVGGATSPGGAIFAFVMFLIGCVANVVLDRGKDG